MRAIKLTACMVSLMLLSSCIDRYYPGVDEIFTGTLVINASLANIHGMQTVQISRSDGLRYPEFIPESGCLVELEKLSGDKRSFEEADPGYYNTDLEEFMDFGEQYMLRVITPDGNHYLSDYSTLNPPTDIERVYFERESIPTSDPEVFKEGIRFYIDFEINPDSSEYMRWELLETYEFHNPPYDGFIYTYDRVLRPLPDSLDDRQCWISGHVNAIYTLEASNMTSESFTYMPLHFVGNETQRLSYGYSLLVRQHALDEPAFRYWDELKKNSFTQGGLYDRLPSLTPGNIENVENPEERILGFFGVSGVSEQRIFVKDVAGLEKYDVMFCYPYPELPRFRYLMTEDLPVYSSRAIDPVNGTQRFGETVHECLDCRVREGSQGDPPDYWPREE